jgi:hypothetical protein
MKITILLTAAVATLVATGLVHGRWTNRWRPAPEVAKVASELQKLPDAMGDWKLELSRELGARELAMTGAVGHISRIYTNRTTGQSASVLVLTGLPGDISTHTPDICYPGAGYVLSAPETYTRSYGSPEQNAGFHTATATKGGASPSFLRIFWTWRSSKGWSAPDGARWAFAAESLLTKVYIVRDTRGVASDPKDDPCNGFISLLLPELDRLLSPPSNSTRLAAAEPAQ